MDWLDSLSTNPLGPRPPGGKPWFVDPENSKRRLDVCKECPKYIKLSTQCKICLCFMPLKTKLNMSECPMGKWKEVDKEYPNTVNPKMNKFNQD